MLIVLWLGCDVVTSVSTSDYFTSVMKDDVNKW